jgi:nitrite reductase/ring-hydroxylating ferredoxin subunit
MPEPGAAILVCDSAALAERGSAFMLDVLHHGEVVRAFVLRYDGCVVGYVNRCLHVPTEMDWQPGEFLDSSRQWILCSMHGAAYNPIDGRCIGGPCGRGKLTSLHLEEREGKVYWYPSSHLAPAFADESPS